ncbi:MAG: protein tyrosine phosphatase [Myxococcales bacterium]|nr:protein tyrosine phosphatase [Myxococcales bacterium]
MVIARSIRVLLLLGFAALPVAARADTPARPATWGVPISRPGLPNLHRVSDGIYRGAQPTAEGFRELKSMGVKTVVNLRKSHSDARIIAGLGLAYEEIPMHAWSPANEHVVRFLKIVADPARQPVFVHCQHGADRTGTMVAAYRMALFGWSADDAIREMVDGGFGYHAIWRGLIAFLRQLDVPAVKKLAGLAKS